MPYTFAELEGATVSLNDKETKLTDLPLTSVIALIQRGANHVLGNEVASRVSTAKKATNDDGSLKYDEAGLEKLEADTFEAKLKAIFEGTLGVRIAGVSRDPLSKFKRDFAVMLLKTQYAKKEADAIKAGQPAGSFKWPTGKGSGDVIAEMVGKVLNHPKWGPKATEYAEQEAAKAKALVASMGDDQATDEEESIV